MGGETMKPITDAVGQELLVARQPQRVVCLAPYIADAAVLLGATPCIVGMSDECQQPTIKSGIPYVGETREPNMAMIRLLDPDLIIAGTDATPERALADLIQLHKPVFHVHASTVQDGLDLVDNLGTVLWRSRAAARIRLATEEAIAYAEQRADGRIQPTVLCVTWRDPLCVAMLGTYTSDLIRVAGGVNIAPITSKEKVGLNFTEIAELNPDVILLQDHPCGLSKADVDTIFIRVNCAATLNQDVFLVSGKEMLYPGPRTGCAVNNLIRLFHP